MSTNYVAGARFEIEELEILASRVTPERKLAEDVGFEFVSIEATHSDTDFAVRVGVKFKDLKGNLRYADYSVNYLSIDSASLEELNVLFNTASRLDQVMANSMDSIEK